MLPTPKETPNSKHILGNKPMSVYRCYGGVITEVGAFIPVTTGGSESTPSTTSSRHWHSIWGPYVPVI